MNVPLTKAEINAIVDQKIKAHEIRVGIISGIIGVLLIAGLFHLLFTGYLIIIK